MKTTPQKIRNLPLHLLIEKHAQEIKYGSVTYTCILKDGGIDVNTINFTIARRRRYKPEVAKR
jgi:hypothetical protein